MNNIRDVAATLAADGRTILDGHHRIKAIRELGIEFVRIGGKVYDIRQWNGAQVKPAQGGEMAS